MQAKGEGLAALESFGAALAVDPHYAKAAIDMGSALRLRNGPEDLAQAAMHLRGAIAAEADRYEAWHELGLVQQRLGRSAEAERSLRTAAGLAVTCPVLTWDKLPRWF